MKAALPSLALQVDLLPNCQHLIPRLARLRLGRRLLDRSIVRVRWGCLQRRKHVVLRGGVVASRSTLLAACSGSLLVFYLCDVLAQYG